MSSLLERGVRVIEVLAAHPEGVALSAIASATDTPLSATHRLLVELVRLGYARQLRDQGDYVLTIKLVSLGLSFLSASGVVDVAQPSIDALAETSHELVRLAIVDGEELVFVAKAQGAVRGLRYDPDMGLSVPLSCSAAGHALLSTMSDEQAMERVARQGLAQPRDFGPRAPTSITSVLASVRRARKLGYATIAEMYAPGMSAMAAPVRLPNGPAIGVVTIAGPSVRLTEARMSELALPLMATAQDVMDASKASTMFAPSRRSIRAAG